MKSFRRPCSSWRRAGSFGVALLLLATLARSSAAAPVLRYQTDQRGDLLMFGNTVGFDCRAGIPKPVVGTVDTSMCGSPTSVDDSSSDVFWRSEDSGSATAGASIMPNAARSTAVLDLPDGAEITYARLYWSATLREDPTTDSSVVFERPGSFSQTITAKPEDLRFEFGGSGYVYQGSADVTALLQDKGKGAYRLSGAARFQLVDRDQDVNYVAWGVIVVYRRATDPIRNFTIWDGLTTVQLNSKVDVTINGFRVPPGGSVDSKLAVIAYEGDHDKLGDSMIFNGTKLSDGQMGSEDNFFNSSRTKLGQAVTIAGELPQLTGAMGSMNGIDMDIVNVTPLLTANQTTAQITLTSNLDVYFLGPLATAITSKKPIIETTLTYPMGTSTRPGDVVELTLTTKNVGDDDGTNVYIDHPIPPGLSYVPGSVRVVMGPNQGNKTDAIGDDQVEYDPGTRTLRIRVGSGANASMGGTVKPNEAPIVVKYQIRIDDNAAPGPIPTQAVAKATPGGMPAAGETPYPSGDGVKPGRPTIILVPPCGNNGDCTIGAPVCDLASKRCTDACTRDSDCKGAAGGKEVCGGAMKCVQCSPASKSACMGNGPGTVCLPSGACGCMSNADCGGRMCDLKTNSCPKPDADLHVTVTVDPDPLIQDAPGTYTMTVTNKGPATAPPGTVVTFDIPSGGIIEKIEPGDGWRCSLMERTVRCMYNRPIENGATSPPVRVTVRPTGPSGPDGQGSSEPPTVNAKVTVTTDTANDPNPGDNTVNLTTLVGVYRVAGGGFSCAVARDTSSAGTLGALSALGLLAAALGTRRRRRVRA